MDWIFFWVEWPPQRAGANSLKLKITNKEGQKSKDKEKVKKQKEGNMKVRAQVNWPIKCNQKIHQLELTMYPSSQKSLKKRPIWLSCELQSWNAC